MTGHLVDVGHVVLEAVGIFVLFVAVRNGTLVRTLHNQLGTIMTMGGVVLETVGVFV